MGAEAELRAEVERLRAQLATVEAELEDRKQFVAQVMEAEDRARQRIAQLIHDDALQNLLAVNQDLIEAAPGRAGVTRAHEVVNATIEHLREAMLALHPVTLEQGGLEQALGAVGRQAARQGGFELEVEVDPAVAGHSDELVLAVVRELLANAARHSGAGTVRLRVSREAAMVTVEVTDDGHGMTDGRRREALAEGHIGLASVAQRVEAAGGAFELESAADRGTVARASLPGPATP